MKLLVACLLVLSAVPGALWAASDAGFVYSKTLIKIIPKAYSPPAAQQEPPSDAHAKNPDPAKLIEPARMIPELQRAPKEFTVEVRPISFLKQRDFIALQPFTDKEGMLILLDPPASAQLASTRMIASADVLFVDADGVIIKIAPEINLIALAEPVESGSPIRAFVYLKAGTTRSGNIQVGDRIQNNYFKTHPVVLE